ARREERGVLHELEPHSRRLLDLAKDLGLLVDEKDLERRRHAHAYRLSRNEERGRTQQLTPQIERARQVRLDPTAARALRARAPQHAVEIAARSLACDLDQAELRHGQHARARAIAGELRLEGLEDLAPVRRVLHVDEVHDEESAQIPQADLSGELRNGLE